MCISYKKLFDCYTNYHTRKQDPPLLCRVPGLSPAQEEPQPDTGPGALHPQSQHSHTWEPGCHPPGTGAQTLQS